MQTAVRLVYPPRCISCGGLVDSDTGLCGTCWRDTPFISGLTCDLCGVPLPGDPDDTPGDDPIHCDDCLTTARPWDRGRAALLYKDNGRKLVLKLKHADRHDIAPPAAQWMARSLADIDLSDALVVPIPLHFRRLLKRRFNQSALLAKNLAKHMDLDWCPDALLRKRYTPVLDGKTKDDRFATVLDSIKVNPVHSDKISGRPILLVDDVMTTGATFTAASEALREAGARHLFTVALARVAKDT
ncbi:MAG: ComF family protein [Rhodobacteraceae bacterium]|nr:ComF family protein [Paracoccaceae bacterium]